jgi:hypothetical protein
MPIRRIGFGFKDGLPRDFLDIVMSFMYSLSVGLCGGGKPSENNNRGGLKHGRSEAGAGLNTNGREDV